ncbi:MAG: gamma carbonic anhydrase family protein [Rhodospirillaceae bacterium TMED8]|nr:gamma carbonic anhydrase family protein [Magnetovibrio sp.]OUT51985.1 MAG: gamma carbonic anhydrase family protein [Rhodospirillaceae bacterium TMED8]|tara:strand:- start:86 stop:673 length:588 start_codon:yes stop_codon:yes gene_type:complete
MTYDRSSNILQLGSYAPKIADDAFIASTAVIIGDVEIGEKSNIWYHCVVRGDIHEIKIGRNTNIQDGSVVHVARGRFGTYIGDNVTVGHMALIHACTLEDSCMVGMHATVMDGVVVESDALVAAGSLVTPGKRVPTGEMWGGLPARFIRKVNNSDVTMMKRIAPGYVELGGEYRDNGLDLRQLFPNGRAPKERSK